MATLHYLDNEVPAFGEWDSIVEAGSSTIVQSTDAAFPERGAIGLRVSIVSNAVAYAVKNTVITLAPGDAIHMGMWIRLLSFPATSLTVLRLLSGGNTAIRPSIAADGRISWGYRKDSGWTNAGSLSAYFSAMWEWLVVAIRRATSNVASDGWARIYINGALLGEATGIDNYDVLAPAIDANAGTYYAIGASGAIYDFDETKIATSYPEPFVPTPLTEYPEARRTVILFRQASADSRAFADYCVSELDIPRSNLCPLPNATANETAADYATFETEVEDDTNAWLALNPTVAANCTCFLIGYGVPGYFTQGAGLISATSRLMDLGVVYDGSSDSNAFYLTTDRITKTLLGTDKYMAMRIDADTLAHAKDIIDAGITASALPVLPATDKLFSDNAAYRASLACQHLRIIQADMGTFAADAFIFGDAGTPAWGAAGSRIAFVDNDSAASAESLRTAGGSECAAALITGGYAAAAGRSSGTGLEVFDDETYFEHLRQGHTIAEAFLCCTPLIRWRGVFAGSPFITTAFSTSGYNLYRGSPGELDIDFDTPVVYLRAGESTASLTIAPDIDTTYKYALRAVRNGIETPGIDAIADFTTDGAGDWTGNRPAIVIHAGLEQRTGGVLRAYWHYLTSAADAHDFALWYGTEIPTGAGAADATESYDADRLYFHDFTLTDGLAYYVRIVARTAGGIESEPLILGPLAADATAPEESSTHVSQTF